MTLNNNLYRILERRTTDTATVYDVELQPGCPIYRAHFPTMPVTPGVCLVQMAVELLSDALHVPLSLVGVKNVKFLAIVSPTATPRVSVSLSAPQASDGLLACKATVTAAGSVMTKMSFSCQAQPSSPASSTPC